MNVFDHFSPLHIVRGARELATRGARATHTLTVQGRFSGTDVFCYHIFPIPVFPVLLRSCPDEPLSAGQFGDNFRVTMDEDMEELISSIRSYGIITPLIVRPTEKGNYEIISGHRRKYAATVLGLLKIPVIIRYMSDDLAILSMVDTNLRREKLPPSEKAAAYRMKYEALCNLRKEYGRQKVDKALSGRSVNLLSNKTGDSPKQVQRYVRLSYLIPDLSYLLDLVIHAKLS